MNAQVIKARLLNNPDAISDLLNSAGFAKVSFNSHRQEIRAAREEGRNETSVAVKVNTLHSACYSSNVYGDIITLIQDKLELNFVRTLEYIGNLLNIDVNIEYTPPFGGFYHTVCKTGGLESYQVQTYKDEILRDYMMLPSQLFLNDNISIPVQQKYQIGYDVISKRIIVPWRYVDGKIGGIMGRYNSLDIKEGTSKWMSVIPFPKSYFLFGYSNNYNQIVKNKSCIMTESEKGTMQLSTYGFDRGLSCGGSYISPRARDLIKSLEVKKTLLAFDEGLERDFIHEHAKEIKDSLNEDAKVAYIYDKNNEILKKGSKDSPTDLGRDKFLYLAKNFIYYV